jgi:hypothetical protein
MSWLGGQNGADAANYVINSSFYSEDSGDTVFTVPAGGVATPSTAAPVGP